MQLSSVDVASALIKSEVETKYENLLINIDGVTNELDKQIVDWQQTSERTLQQDDPFIEHAEKFSGWQQKFEIGELVEYSSLIKDYQSFSRSARLPFDKDFWQQQLLIEDNSNRAKKQERHTAEQLLLKNWQKKLDEAQVTWQLEKLQVLRKMLLSQIEEWLSLLSSLQESLEELGLEPGIWLDLSRGELKPQDIEKFKRWAKYLTDDEGAQAICELLGKIRQVAKSERIERIKQSLIIDTPYVDTNSKEEIVGLRLGKDIEHVLPSELALLSDPDTATLFDLKFLESRLLCFEMQGISFAEDEREIEVEQTQEENEQQGPMILCVDTSGSMQGEPEHIAKAMALFLASQARSKARPCYLINFSADIETFDLTGSEGLSSLISFLSKSFHGGTDVAPALDHALKVIKQELYKKADVLVISDFIMGTLPSSTLEALNTQREYGNSFYSLVVGDCFMTERLKTHFDHEWVYNPRLSKIHELAQFSRNITE
ncbi:VWA domain-containing protein [Pseudoalteromonas phenolica]|uniref:VWA domain-containing protein n=1 Tax=Pseudoalteromonas phenolica TaxID=161398 RepID=UPI00110A119C|nr:VWA domain-containing protein [Pseudoalteromonas phenolica]TMO57102.1 hypothetical protein CWC21_04240 [Pseudoalteromonas phenolica]